MIRAPAVIVALCVALATASPVPLRFLPKVPALPNIVQTAESVPELSTLGQSWSFACGSSKFIF